MNTRFGIRAAKSMWWWGIVLAMGLMAAHPASADGFFSKSFAAKALPSIPSQRALLVYREGVERLVIESSLEGEGEAFGWIIPVPAKPTAFEQATPGLIKTLSGALQPKIVKSHATRGKLAHARLLVAVIAAWGILIVLWRPRAWYWPAVLLLIFLCASAVLFLTLLAPAFRYAGTDLGSSSASRVLVEEQAHVGSYDLAVLKADSARALNKWLTENGFSGLPPEGESIVRDYIADGWHFVSAKLRREGDGLSRPHPLAITFPIDEPVYPMRLTALAQSNVYLELFVVAEGTASQDRLALEIADQLVPSEEVFDDGGLMPPRGGAPGGFKGGTYFLYVEHPDAASTMWDGCTISKLTGTLSPEQMTPDLAVRIGPAHAERKTYYAKDAVRDAASALALLAWSVAMAVGILLAHAFLRKGSRGRLRTVAVLGILVPVTVVSYVVQNRAHALLPQVDVQESPHGMRRDMTENAQRVAECYDGFQDVSPEEAVQILVDHFTYGRYRNPFTGGWLAFEDSPGNVQVFQDERGVVFRVFGFFGYPWDTVMKPYTPTDQLGLGLYPKMDLDTCIEQLGSEHIGERMDAAREIARHYRDGRAVLSLINAVPADWDDETLGPYTPRLIERAARALERITGFSAGRPRTPKAFRAYWDAWWETHKDEPRIEWLREAFEAPKRGNRKVAALELAKLGDACGAEVLRRMLAPSGAENYSQEAALALVGLVNKGELEGLGRYTDRLPDSALAHIEDPAALATLLRRWQIDPDYYLHVNELADIRTLREQLIPVMCRCAREPARNGLVVLDHLRHLIQAPGIEHRPLVEALLAILAVTTQTPSPPYTWDSAITNAFLDEVERKLNALAEERAPDE